MKKKSTTEKSNKTLQLKGPPSKSVVNFKPMIASDDPMRHVGKSPAAQTLTPNSSSKINTDNPQIAESAFTKSYKHLRNAKIRRANKNLDNLFKAKLKKISKSPTAKSHLMKAIKRHIYKELAKIFRK